MIKRRVEPRGSRVALRAVLRKAGIGVIWNARDAGRAGVILSVATVAIVRQRAGVVVGVARTAGYRRMRARQWKGGLAVIERSGGPRRSVVADLALLRDARLHMIGSGGCAEIFRVATVAIGGRVRELAIDMA